MLIGGLVGFSMIGIEWSKLQWLVAALGVGLGFGLQEIFANFISGLIILFEKPIRIGDTVTIRDLTGSVTHQYPATTISDWDQRDYRAEQGRSSPSSLSTGRCRTRSPAWC
jgi:potassium efflux system protein